METYVIVCPTMKMARYYLDVACYHLRPILTRRIHSGKHLLETADGIRLEFVSEEYWYDLPDCRGLCLGRHDVIEMQHYRFLYVLNKWESMYW